MQSRREGTQDRLQSPNAEREKAIKALCAEIMDAYGLCRPWIPNAGSGERS